MTGHSIAVTGVTGVVGRLVWRHLTERGIGHRLLARRPDVAPHVPGSTVHRVDYADPDSARDALEGVETLLMVSAAESVDRLHQHRTFIDAAAEAGVGHVVYTSFVAAGPDATFTLARDHGATEDHIRVSGMAWTFLRDNFYSDFMEHMVGDDGVIRGPAGEGRAAIVARADVARTAGTILADPAPHVGQTYEITGPKALTMDEVAATISRVRDRDVSFHDETVEEAYASRASYGAPEWQLDAWVSTYTAIASGELAHVSDDVRRITGTEPLSLEDLLRRTR